MFVKRFGRSTVLVCLSLLFVVGSLFGAQMVSGDAAQDDPFSAGRVVVDNADSLDNWKSGALDTEDKKEGAAALTISGSNIGFMHKGNLGMELPADWWYNWDIEFWFYVDKPQVITDSLLEFSQEQDGLEAQYTKYAFQQGWQKIRLPLGQQGAGGSNNRAMKTLNTMRLLVFSSEAVVIKMDDMALVRRDEILNVSCDTLPAFWGNASAAEDSERGKVLETTWTAAGGSGPYRNNNMLIPFPDKAEWDQWVLDMWLYVNDVDLVKAGFLEFSEERDKSELQWDMGRDYTLQDGWNHLELSLAQAKESAVDGNVMDVLNQLRFYVESTGPDLVAKFDDIKIRHVSRKAEEITIAFDSDGGTAVPEQTIELGMRIAEPDAPTKDGLEFLGWYHGQRLWLFDRAPTKSLTLKAKWHDPAATPDKIVIDSCDTYEGWRVRLNPAAPNLTQRPPLTAENLDITNQVEGTGCLTLDYNGTPGLFGFNFVGATDAVNPYQPHEDGQMDSQYNIPLPEDWTTDWEIVCSLYVSDASKLDANAPMQLELSEAVDQKEVEWNDKYPLATGWNTVVMKVSNMRQSGEEPMKILNHIRLHLHCTDAVTIRLDNIYTRRVGSTSGDPDANIDYIDPCDVKDVLKYYYIQQGENQNIDVQIGKGPSELGEKSAYLFNDLPIVEGKAVLLYGTNPGTIQAAITMEDDTVVEFWVFVEDASKVNSARFELGSSYKNDECEREYDFTEQIKADGWNRVIIPVNSGYSASGTLDLNNIVRYRMFFGSGETSGTLDFGLAGFRIGQAPVVIQYGSLDAQLLRAERREKYVNDYTKASGDAFLAVLKEARALRERVDVTQEDVNAMTEKLKEAINSMVLLSNESDGKDDDNSGKPTESEVKPAETGVECPLTVLAAAFLSAAAVLACSRKHWNMEG